MRLHQRKQPVDRPVRDGSFFLTLPSTSYWATFIGSLLPPPSWLRRTSRDRYAKRRLVRRSSSLHRGRSKDQRSRKRQTPNASPINPAALCKYRTSGRIPFARNSAPRPACLLCCQSHQGRLRSSREWQQPGIRMNSRRPNAFDRTE